MKESSTRGGVAGQPLLGFVRPSVVVLWQDGYNQDRHGGLSLQNHSPLNRGIKATPLGGEFFNNPSPVGVDPQLRVWRAGRDSLPVPRKTRRPDRFGDLRARAFSVEHQERTRGMDDKAKQRGFEDIEPGFPNEIRRRKDSPLEFP